MNRLTPEKSLLLFAARTGLDKPTLASLRESAVKCDWTLLVETAYAHGVASLLCNSLLKMPVSLIPAEILSAAGEHLQKVRLSNQVLADQLTFILKELSLSGIDAIPFKGPTLAIRAYGDMSLRTFRDLDFLINEEHIQLCLKKMQSIEYKQVSTLTARQMTAFLKYSGQDILYGGVIPVEPHWTLAPYTMSFNIDYQGLWSRSDKELFNGKTVRFFSAEDELTILCIHGCKEKWTKLKWVADVAEFISRHPKLDWESLFTRAKSRGLMRMIVLGLSLANQLLKAPLPNSAIDWMERDSYALNWGRELAEEFFDVEKRTQSIYIVSGFHWNMRERLRDRWKYLYRTITQPREQHFNDIALPDSLFFLYTPYKILHDYLALPIWTQLKKLRRNPITTKPGEPKHTDATN